MSPSATLAPPALPQRLLADELPRGDKKELTAAARELAASAPADAQPLRGKHIALLCTSPQCEPAAIFEAAASALGARVSRVLPLDMRSETAFRDTARMLGRLYDAVECDHLTSADAARLADSAGVPVFNGLARPDHPLQRLARARRRRAGAAGAASADARLWVQAALLKSLA